jgi:catechol 2,3-dioxygenase-like lactoylglutathione lyase family enzyme
MPRLWTIIGVRDMRRSFAWYQMLLGLPPSAPAHDDWGQIADRDGTVLLNLHLWEAHGHPTLMSPKPAKPGNGLLLFFVVDDYRHALQRARRLGPRLAEKSHVNPNTGAKEFSVRDPDGYYVTLSAFDDGVATRRTKGKRTAARSTSRMRL